MNEPSVSIIIISHHHGPYLERCLRSILVSPPKYAFEVVLINNVADDDDVERIAASFPAVRFVQNQRSFGFSQNCNEGIRRTSGRYILLLNPDTVVVPGAIDELMEFMDRQPEAGAAAARLMFPDGSLQLSCRRFPTIASTLIRRTPLRRWFLNGTINQEHLMADMDHTQPQPIDWALGACLMLRRATLDVIGVLDERFPLYCEDIDLCYRIAQYGQKVYYIPSAVVVHHHLAVSDKQFWTRRTLWHLQGMLWFVLKHYVMGKIRRRQLHVPQSSSPPV